MQITRRSVATALCAATSSPVLVAAPQNPWTSEWDTALIQAAVERLSDSFDPLESMLRSTVGPEYRYHTTLRSQPVHGTRDTLRFALFLLEAGQLKKAAGIIDRVLSLQDTDPASKWYGLWSYYLEEPLPKMAPADWNWADFNGSVLLLMEFRHGSKLDARLRLRVREAVGHAAASVRRRNVSMGYTNIAVQGTFVTLAAAEVRGDKDLLGYARERLTRFARTVDETGSFNEYNSPTYANVTIENLTRMLMYVRDQECLPLIRKLHHRAWLHLASHWHAPTRQLAGPMSRAYSTDIGSPLWIQKALNNRLLWVDRSDFAWTGRGVNGDIALVDYKVPDELAPMFLELREPRQHREIFLPGGEGVRPVQGTTWLTEDYTLGSINRGDFWVQRRPLLAFWGKQARSAQLRFLKDDYDFCSASIYTVQQQGYILGLVNFRTPGGDKHVSLDPLPSEFPAERLRLALELPEEARVLDSTASGQTNRASFALGGSLKLSFAVRRARFGEFTGTFAAGSGGVSFDLLKPGGGRVRWSDIDQAFIVFTLAIESGPQTVSAFDGRISGMPFDEESLEWSTPVGKLRIQGSRRVGPIREQDRAFGEFLNGEPVPLVRLSEQRLA